VLSGPEGQQKLIYTRGWAVPTIAADAATAMAVYIMWCIGAGFFVVEFSIFPLHTTPLCRHGRVLAFDIF